jgi:hypothetical protein
MFSEEVPKGENQIIFNIVPGGNLKDKYIIAQYAMDNKAYAVIDYSKPPNKVKVEKKKKIKKAD